MVETRTANGTGAARRKAAAAGAKRGKRTSGTRSISRKKTSAKTSAKNKARKIAKSAANNAAKRSEKKAARVLRKGKKPLATMTESALEEYFRKLNGTTPGDLYDLVLSEVERPLFRTVLAYTEGNQSRAADILGINRGTLRKKLKAYSISIQ